MDRFTRKELKTDKFALEVGHTVDYFTEHRKEILRYGGIGLGVLLLIIVVWSYRSHEQTAQQDALKAAMRIQSAPVGPSTPGEVSYPTAEERNKAAMKAFAQVASEYSGSDAGVMARYYMAANLADQGNLNEAEKAYREVADSGKDNYASLAKMALAPIVAAKGNVNEAEKLLRSVMDHPTIFVSRDEAAIQLAKLLAPRNPQEARKLLTPLVTSSRMAINRAAGAELGQLPR